MPEADRLQTQRAYGDVIREVSQRLYWLDHLLTGRSGMSQLLVRESGFLQVRMICELIALGCLIVHGDIPATRTPRLQKQWSADRILEELERLHPNFFPEARRLESRGPGQWHLAERPGALDKARLAALYGRCGGKLHRGSALKLVQAGGVHDVSLDELDDAARELKQLVRTHSIALLDPDLRIAALVKPSIEGTFEVLFGEATS